jgi:hypothetical protein
MIDSLTPEQEAKMPEYVAKWTAIGKSTEPCDVEASKKWINEIYKVSELDPPKYFFYFQSPQEAARATYMLDSLTNFDDSYTDTEIYGSTDEWDKIFEKVWDQYSTQYTEPDIVWDDSTKARMRSFISKAFTATCKNDKVVEFLDHMMYGSHDAAWFSFYEFFLNECGFEEIEPLRETFELAKYCGWWSSYEECAIIQDRPCELNITGPNNDLHCDFGPVVAWRDGNAYYALENHWFNELVVMRPEEITVEMIDEEPNAEKRRILMQRYGFERYIENAGLEKIDSDFVRLHPEVDEVMPRMLVKNKNGDLFLVGCDGSTKERVYVMPIANSANFNRLQMEEIKTCREAHEFISGLDESLCVAQG